MIDQPEIPEAPKMRACFPVWAILVSSFCRKSNDEKSVKIVRMNNIK